MKPKDLLFAAALWCLVLAGMEFAGTRDKYLIYDVPWELSKWGLFLVSLLVSSRLWMRGMRYWLLPLVALILLFNPVYEVLGGALDRRWQTYVVAAIAYLAYVPEVRKSLDRIWRD
ncbi:MAG: hypothetical protein JWO82_3364 [Akkermansiaceae bacterium]|nr:hypothetical protein [Akkermansiaceae bacterium]